MGLLAASFLLCLNTLGGLAGGFHCLGVPLLLLLLCFGKAGGKYIPNLVYDFYHFTKSLYAYWGRGRGVVIYDGMW